MNTVKRYGVVLGGVLAMAGAAMAGNQVWLKQTVEGSLVKERAWAPLQIKVEQEGKYDERRIIDSETLLLVGWKMNPYLSAFVGDRWVCERAPNGKGKMRAEQRPTFDLCLAAPEFWTLKLDFRSRFEYRDKHGSSAYMRHRERLRLRTSWSVTDFKISPYASEELFFFDKPNTDKADLYDRNRAQVGLSFKPVSSVSGLSMNLYYMAQHDWKKDHGWKPTNVFGLEVGYKF